MLRIIPVKRIAPSVLKRGTSRKIPVINCITPRNCQYIPDPFRQSKKNPTGESVLSTVKELPDNFGIEGKIKAKASINLRAVIKYRENLNFRIIIRLPKKFLLIIMTKNGII